MLACARGEEMEPAFWQLDSCNMDDAFVFSFYRTREEWEEEERRARTSTKSSIGSGRLSMVRMSQTKIRGALRNGLGKTEVRSAITGATV